MAKVVRCNAVLGGGAPESRVGCMLAPVRLARLPSSSCALVAGHPPMAHTCPARRAVLSGAPEVLFRLAQAAWPARLRSRTMRAWRSPSVNSPDVTGALLDARWRACQGPSLCLEDVVELCDDGVNVIAC